MLFDNEGDVSSKISRRRD